MPLSPKERTRAQFRRVASNYRCSADHTDIEDLDLLFTGLALDPAHRVLDVATGGGHTAAALAGRCGRVVASDLTPSMLREARVLASEHRAGNVVFAAADAEALPFRDASFDRVTCRIAPHHFPDVRAAMSEMVRVTRPGGRIGIIDSMVPGEPSLDAFLNGVEKVRDPSHVRSYRVEEWLELTRGRDFFSCRPPPSGKPTPSPNGWRGRAFPRRCNGRSRRSSSPPFRLRGRSFRIRTEGGRVVSYSDEKAIFVAKKPGGAPG